MTWVKSVKFPGTPARIIGDPGAIAGFAKCLQLLRLVRSFVPSRPGRLRARDDPNPLPARNARRPMSSRTPPDVAAAPATSKRLGDQVHEALVEQIAAGRYPVGSRLPSEFELAAVFGVSRPVLRQALGRLKAEGIITTRQGAGNFVLRRNESRRLEYGPLQNLPDVQRCLEFRCGLETEAARRAAIARNEDAIDGIARAIDAMERAIGAGGSSIEADFEFHLAIARASQNRFFVTTLEALRSQVEFGIKLSRSFATTPLNERLDSVLAEHREIHEAIRAGDPDRAKRAVALHLEAGIARLFA
ncbi:MAG: FadR family transcriptional regulator [Burkholderiales bacterium]|nr:FadR family transcriptional regulator [Burkholderiales bacterium]